MDKLAAKEVLEYIGVKTAPFRIHVKGTPPIDFASIKKSLGAPLFVKPTKTGSSVGISKVHEAAELAPALELAHRYDDVVLIESAVPGAREIEVACLGNRDDAKASLPGEIVPDREFYDYESKYSDDSTSQGVIPADLPPDVAEQIQSTAVKAYQALGCSGLARVDFLLGADGSIILNEINTLPGFTNISMYPKLWGHMGLSQTKLIDRLLELAVARSRT
jgi:D-alanine-D-alanine ligase